MCCVCFATHHINLIIKSAEGIKGSVYLMKYAGPTESVRFLEALYREKSSSDNIGEKCSHQEQTLRNTGGEKLPILLESISNWWTDCVKSNHSLSSVTPGRAGTPGRLQVERQTCQAVKLHNVRVVCFGLFVFMWLEVGMATGWITSWVWCLRFFFWSSIKPGRKMAEKFVAQHNIWL